MAKKTTTTQVLPTELTYHAYALVGDQQTRDLVLQELETVHNISVQGNPDFVYQSFDTFTIDDSRAIKAQHETKPMQAGAQKVFVLTMNGITVEAQNALLKLLEEPAEYAKFILILPSAHLLLPTVKSRLHVISAKKGDKEKNAMSDERTMQIRAYIAMSVAQRLNFVKEIVDEIAKDDKVKQDAINFLNDLEAVLYLDLGAKKGQKALRAIAHARGYMNDRAPSVKMLLEYVSLSI